MLDFPAAPAMGQKYPAVPTAGVPQYTWDGEKWTMAVAAAPGVIASDTPPPNAVDGTMWFESDTGLLYILYNDGNSRQWVIAAPQPDFSGLVTKAEATPLDALAYNGLQVNGGMQVSQENGAAQIDVSNTGKHTLDSWVTASIGAAVSTRQVTSAPVGFAFSQITAVGTANAAPAATDRITIATRIEGYRIARLGWGTASAKPITLSFWTAAIRPGTYSGAVTSGARAYPFTFAINAPSTWEYKTVVIPGDVTGTWSNTNTLGIEVFFAMMLGASWQAPAGAWTAGVLYGATGTINGAASTTDQFFITGVTVLPGTLAPTAAQSPLLMRPYGEELALCQRYYSKFTPPYFGGPWATGPGHTAYHSFIFPAQMRAAPTCTILAQPNNSNCTASPNGVTDNTMTIAVIATAAGGFYAGGCVIQNDARL